MNTLLNLKKELKSLANPEQAKILQGFFKTGKGQYGEGDIFLGIKVPVQRMVVKKYKDLSLADTEKLVSSKVHEERLIAILILVHKYEEGGENIKKEIFDFYLQNTKNINNWDLVDLSAPKIVGNYLLNKSRKILYKLVKSKSLWERRIAIVSTFAFIRNNEFEDTLKISELLLSDNHDLIHKAVGWMLREVGKRDEELLKKFLDKNYKKIPRTTLRYAIERFEESERKKYLLKK